MTKPYVPAITELDGIGIQPVTPADAAVVSELLNLRANRFVADLPSDQASLAQMIAAIAGQPWTLPLAATRGNECVGVMTSVMPDLKSLNASCVALFVDPPDSTLPLAVCLRHLFWSFPLRRLHVQIPDTDMTREYVSLFESVGFHVEGRLVDHAVIAGQTFDMFALGLLRSDFESWCDANDPRLSLTAETSS